MLSCASTIGSIFLTGKLRNPSVTLSDQSYATAIRWRLGAAQGADIPARCACNKPLDPSCNHFAACRLKGGPRAAVIARHDNICNTLNSIARRCGLAVEKEPQFPRIELQLALPNAKSYRVDASHMGSVESDSALIDVSVVTPTCDSFIDRHAAAAGRALGIAELRERAKRAKHGPYADACGLRFRPFVMESFGAFGKEAQLYIKKLAEKMSNAIGHPVSVCRLIIRQELGFALQQGNAQMVRSGLLAVRTMVARAAGHGRGI